MFVNFCSKLALWDFNRLTLLYHKGRHVITYRRPRISSKMLPTFSNSDRLSKLLQKSDWRWPERLNGGGLYDHTWWLSTPKMRVFQLFLKIRIFSTLPGLDMGRKPEISAIFQCNSTTNTEDVYSRHRARLWVNSTRNHAFLDISSVLAAWFNHKGHVIHPRVVNILRPYIHLSVFPMIVMTLNETG